MEHLICQADLALCCPLLSHFFAIRIYVEPSSQCEVRNVKNTSTPTILFVDDEPCMRELMALILGEEGYETYTATDGFDALAQLRDFNPDLIISDLHMPRMSGVEFLSVIRHRFPAIPVIAISGALDRNEISPAGVMADAFFSKARCHPDELVRTIDALMRGTLPRPTNYHPCHPPRVQTARMARDANGVAALQLTCTDGLRAFSWPAQPESGGTIQQAECRHCKTAVNFVSDFALHIPARVLTACDAATMPAI
jgi:CheY-like chemotaxis protein